MAPPSASATEISLPLTFFDLLWLRFPPVERLYFYEISPQNKPVFDSVLPKLKHSLSLTLHHFLPLAGNLIWPHNSRKPIIHYVQGDAVTLTIAESHADFYHLSGTDFCEATECHPLVPRLSVSHEKAALMALQVTWFPNCGFCIGITTHHAAVDGKISTSFVKSWAHVCKLGGDSPPAEMTPFYDRTVIKDSTGLDAIFVNDWLNLIGPNSRSLMVWELKVPPGAIRGTFELTRASLEKLRQMVLSKKEEKLKHEHEIHVSTFSLTCAYMWVCLVKAQRPRKNKMRFVFSVDCRSRLEPPIPPTYFGNCIAGHLAFAETQGLLGEDGVAVAVDAMSEAMGRLREGCLNGAEGWISLLSTVEERAIAAAGSPRFEVYGSDFGWGRPRKVEMTSIDRTGAFCLAESRNGSGGVEIQLVLKKQEMEDFSRLFYEGLEI